MNSNFGINSLNDSLINHDDVSNYSENKMVDKKLDAIIDMSNCDELHSLNKTHFHELKEKGTESILPKAS